MNNDEILIIQNYLRDIFDNEDISVRKDQDVPPTASIFISSEAIGNLQKDDDPDEEDISYSLTIPIDHSITDKENLETCLLYTSPSPRDATLSRMPSSA